MNRSIVAGNWKMHGSRQFVEDYVVALSKHAERTPRRLVLIPPVGYLSILVEQLKARGLSSTVEVGAQNLHEAAEGAFTGEMSGEMLKDLGAAWVLVGHSERREYAAESNELVGEKVAAALRLDLQPMLCIGETESERDAGMAEEVVIGQLDSVIERCGVSALANGAIAYEPVWAIGTGRTATPEMAQEMHGVIRAALSQRSAKVAEQTPILYGGSVKSANAVELFAQQDIDGGLVGGASLVAEEFLRIANCP